LFVWGWENFGKFGSDLLTGAICSGKTDESGRRDCADKYRTGAGREVTMTTVTVPKINESYIKSKALSVLETHRIWQPPVDAFKLARANGFSVVAAIFREDVECVAGFIDIASKKIVVNANDSLEQQNFTIAHELGHYLLDHHLDAEFVRNYSVLMRNACVVAKNWMELEADIFADNLLVPAMFLREYVSKYPLATDYELARIFGVDPEVIRYRRPFSR